MTEPYLYHNMGVMLLPEKNSGSSGDTQLLPNGRYHPNSSANYYQNLVNRPGHKLATRRALGNGRLSILVSEPAEANDKA